MRSYLTIVLAFALSFTAIAQDKEAKTLLDRPDLPGKLILDYGYNFLQNNPSNFGNKAFESKSVGLHYVREFFPINNISISAGAGFGFEKLSFTGGNVLGYDNNDVLTYEPSDEVIKKSKLATTYIQIPVDIRYYPGGEGNGTRFFVGVGGYVGYLIDAHSKVSFLNTNTKLRKERGDFNLNEFRYGLTMKLGFDSFHLIGKYDLSEIFKSNNSPLDNGNANMWSIGFAIDTF